MTPSTGRVDQLVPQRDQHALDAGDLIQDRGDEDLACDEDRYRILNA